MSNNAPAENATHRTPWTPNQYPTTRRTDHVDTYKSKSRGEVKVPDPYNWLEGNTEGTDKWTTVQQEFTRRYLDQNTQRNTLEVTIRANSDYAKFSAPSLKKDGKWYWQYNSGLQAQYVIYRSLDDNLPGFSKDPGALGGEPFFDSNLLTKDGTGALAVTKFSKCGKYFAYGVSLSGSDFCTIYVRTTDSPFSTESQRGNSVDGRLTDEVRYVKFSSIDWTHDSKGFFYQRMPTRESHGEAGEDKAGTETVEDLDAMLYYHLIGAPQSEDILVMKDASNRDWMWGTQVSEVDGRYVALYVSKDTSRKHLLWISDLHENTIDANMKWTKVIDNFEGHYEILGNDGTKFYLRTNKDAPKYKIITLDIADKSFSQKDIVPEQSDAKLEYAYIVNNDIIVTVHKRNVKDEIHIFSLDGTHLQQVAKDFVGTITLSAKREESWFFATLVGFTTPGTVAKYDFNEPDEKKRWSVYRETNVKGIKASEFTTEQLWYNSKDGTKVPMFVVKHKDTPTDGSAPGIQYGYGGFSISIGPFFSVAMLTFIQKYRAVLAVPNIRGGGEFGEEWHQAGTKERKINVFDDFIAATQYLVNNKIAAPGKVAINGGSNGGLLVAACAERAPEGTFGAAVADVGVHDMLKFHKLTIGRAWISDYGDPDDPNDFDFIFPYSPLHNVPKDKTLPPVLLLTADHDDRVVPLHSYKLIATLQHTLPHNPYPLLIRIDKKAGHGAGKSTEQKIKEAADKFGFVAQSMGLTWYEFEAAKN